jgi:hypothetical protein
MIRLVVRDLAGNMTTLTVKEIITVNGVKFDEPAQPVELTELLNRVKILESVIQPILDVLTQQPPEPPLPPEESPNDG